MLQRFNENHDPATGQFAEGGGSGGGGSESVGTSKLASEKPSSGGKGKVGKISDFQKEGIRVDHDTTINPAKAEKFLQRWNERVQEAPEDFKKEFIGVPGTMTITYDEHNDKMLISGNVQNEDGRSIGSYDRKIDLKNNSAYSAYFVLNKGQRGGGIGKKLLASNVAMYQKMGLDKVTVSANIDVGGYAWARYGYVPTPESWRSLSSDIRDKLNDDGARASHAASGSGYTPESWDMINESNREAIETAWMRSTHDEFLDSEVQNWRDSGGALDDAKSKLANDYSGYQSDWAKATIQTWRENWIAEGNHDIPISDQDILDSIKLEYYDSDGEGRDDPDIEIHDASLNALLEDTSQGTLPGFEPIKPSERLTEETRTEITDALTKEFNSHAEDEAQEMDPPSYIGDNIEESQGDYWSQMDDEQKFEWADRNGELPEYPIEDDEEAPSEAVEASDPQRDALIKLASSSDPKSLWTIADSTQGESLLLNSNWSGVLDFKDKQTMDRFHAYVGK